MRCAVNSQHDVLSFSIGLQKREAIDLGGNSAFHSFNKLRHRASGVSFNSATKVLVIYS